MLWVGDYATGPQAFPASTVGDFLIMANATAPARFTGQEMRQIERASEDRARQIVDGLPVIVTIMDAEGELEGANEHMLEYFGLPLQVLKARPPGSNFHPADRAQFLAMWRLCVETGETFDREARLRRADGVYRWFRIRGFPLRDADGTVSAGALLQIDTDDRRRSDDLLAGERRILEMVAAGEPLANTLAELCILVEDLCPSCDSCSVLLLDQQTNTLWRAASANLPEPYAESVNGFAVGPDANSCGAAAFSGNQVISPDIGADPRWHGFRDIALANGIMACWATPIFSPQGQVSGCFSIYSGTPGGQPLKFEQEVTARVAHLSSIVIERERSQTSLMHAHRELAHFTRVAGLSALTASIAHEVNQPLTGVVVNAGTCMKMLACDPPNVAGALETARRTLRDGNRAADVIARLRTLFTKKASAFTLVDLNDAVHEVLALSWNDLQRNQTVLHLDLADDLPPVAGDRVQLQQVIVNLVLNASDAMGGVDDRARQLMIRTELREGNQVRLSVRDAGTGFDPGEANRLFEAFFTTKSNGMGIGLSVSRSIIECHGGRLAAELNDGPGATFHFSLPRMGSPAA